MDYSHGMHSTFAANQFPPVDPNTPMNMYYAGQAEAHAREGGAGG